MQMGNRQGFLQQGAKALDGIYDWMQSLEPVSLKELPPKNSAFLVVDMVNGFAKGGAMSGPRVKALIPTVADAACACHKAGIPVVNFADCHGGQSPEFEAYPVHCVKGDWESQVVEEIAAVPHTLIEKNSTNGLLEPAFVKWLTEHPHIHCFVLGGDCTDICVYQLAIGLKTWFNRQDRKSRVIVPAQLVDTFDAPGHKADLANALSLYSMSSNGVEVAASLTW